ncbi:MAG: D-glycero-beta-D-manno-heptose-7-phosphate kinase [Candidatus Omnitrophica bacterium]|nr:D-glycero-beta-D-manno-heptose-7-phosphate kinase [Candidatus Omnitrophota bacterium]
MDHKIIAKFAKKTVLVVGDVILDRYIQGHVSRISPEAPVPIVLEEKSFYLPGGAANVACNLAALGAKVVQIGKIGNDFEGKRLKLELKRRQIDVSGLLTDPNVPTITKTRVIAQHQQVVRIDREKVGAPVSAVIMERITGLTRKKIAEIDAVIISDYGKGLIIPELVRMILTTALSFRIPVTVDPKVEHFSSYKGATCITPNRKETENAIRNIKIQDPNGSKLGLLSDKLKTPEDVDRTGEKLLDYLKLDSLLITLGEQGMKLFEKGRKPYAIDTKAQEVFDVTGAGDAVISTFTLALAAGANKRQAAELANLAAGIVVGRMGAVAVTRAELTDALKRIS